MADQNAIEQIYDKLMEVFGGTNPNQFFTMLMPGSNLEAQTYAYDTKQMKPAVVEEAESKLCDQMFDIAKISGSTNGQKLSSQYLQALSVLVPSFNSSMPDLKNTLRNFLNAPVPENTFIDDVPFSGSLQEYYFKLYGYWTDAKMKWEQQIISKKNELSAHPETENEKYLEWYEQVAETELAKVDAAMGKVLAVFSPSDMDAILGALASGPGGEIDEATNTIKNIRMSSPNGGFFYPVSLRPADWFLDLASEIDPEDLLQDPEFIANANNVKMKALQASLNQVKSLLSRMPTNNEIDKAQQDLDKSQQECNKALLDLENSYTSNTLTAVKIAMKTCGYPKSKPDIKKVNEGADKAAKAENSEATTNGATKSTGEQITNEDLDNIAKGMSDLNEKQQNLTTASQKLADAGLNLVSMQAGNYANLPLLLTQLQSQLDDLKNSQDQLDRAIMASASKKTSIPPLQPYYDDATQTSIKSLVDQLDPKKDKDTKTFIDNFFASLDALVKDSDKKTNFQPVKDFVNKSLPSLSQSIYDAVKNLINTDTNLKNNKDAANILNHLSYKSEITTETINPLIPEDQKVKLQPIIDEVTTAQTAYNTDYNSENTRQKIIDAMKNKLTDMKSAGKGAGEPKQSKASERFMELQFSFTSSAMSSKTLSESSSTGSSWGLNLFICGANGKNSSASSMNSEDTFNSNTEIKIGLKAAKVEIERGWFNPGLFKLSNDMGRLSTNKVSGVTNKDGSFDWNDKTLNDSILPCYPVGFVVAKDITMTFEATESSLSTMHSVIDSKKTSGGGFLCFSSPKSTSKHSDTQSMSSKSEGTTIHITMPQPQILGWFLEVTPPDKSSQISLDDTTSISGKEISIISFVNKLSALNPKKA